ncbi:hypothetical protein GCM10010417_10310 [Streptomyces carpaticus]
MVRTDPGRRREGARRRSAVGAAVLRYGRRRPDDGPVPGFGQGRAAGFAAVGGGRRAMRSSYTS